MLILEFRPELLAIGIGTMQIIPIHETRFRVHNPHGELLAMLVGVVLSLKFHRLGLRFSMFVFFFPPFR